jgi:hypothetical protein
MQFPKHCVLWNTRKWTKSKKSIIPRFMQHRQNLLEYKINCLFYESCKRAKHILQVKAGRARLQSAGTCAENSFRLWLERTSPCSLTADMSGNQSSSLRFRKPRLTAVEISCADHATPSIRRSWH